MEEEILLKLKKDSMNIYTSLIFTIMLIIVFIKSLFSFGYPQILYIEIVVLFFILMFLWDIFNVLATEATITSKYIKLRNLSTFYKYTTIFYNDIEYLEIIKAQLRWGNFGRLKIYYLKNKIIDIGSFGLYEEFKEEILSIADFLRRREGYNLIVKTDVPDTGWGI